MSQYWREKKGKSGLQAARERSLRLSGEFATKFMEASTLERVRLRIKLRIEHWKLRSTLLAMSLLSPERDG